MRIFSGRCCKGDVGEPTGQVDMHDNPLFVGDIVQLWHGEYIGTDMEQWYPTSGLTAIVNDRYVSHSDGSHVLENKDCMPYTMGIKSVGVHGDEWKVSLVKSHKDIIPGERIVDYGLNWQGDE